MFHSEQQYKILEEKIKKLEKENKLKEKENKLLKKQNREKDELIHDLDRYNYRGQYLTLKEENKELKKKLKLLETKFDISRISLEKDSSNSCKPSSTNGFKKVIQNNRVKTGKKPGREKGHKKSSPSVSSNPDEIKRVSKVATCTCGCKTEEKEEVARDLISIEIIVHTTQYRGAKTECPHCHKKYMPKFPKGINHPMNYDKSIKSIGVYLNTYCNVPNQKSANFLGFISKGKIKMESSTVLNILKQFSRKTLETQKKMKQKILKAPVINEDETPIKVNGKLASTIGVFTDKISYMKAFENRKLESFEKMGILDRYIGTVCHDHNNIHKSFPQSKDAECNFHILRYCKAQYEIHKWESIKEFMDYMLELRDLADKYRLEGKPSVEKKEYEKIRTEYLTKIDNWDKEHKEKTDKDKLQYYDEERCLRTRLRECVDDHLRFLTDFRIDFTNNLAERRIKVHKEEIKNSWKF